MSIEFYLLPVAERAVCKGDGNELNPKSFFEIGVGQNIALHALPIAKNATILISIFHIHSTSFSLLAYSVK